MKNYISENLKRLLTLENSSMDEFGAKFDLNRGMVSQYIRKIATPKLETIQKICFHYEITIDDFVNKDLSAKVAVGIKQGELLYANEPVNDYTVISPRYVESLERIIVEKDQALKDKQKIIEMLEEKINPDKRKQA